MRQQKIDLFLLDKILQKVGYSPAERERFKDKFVALFLQKLSLEILAKLPDDKQKEAIKLTSSPKPDLQQIDDFLNQAGLSRVKREEIMQQVWQEMSQRILRTMMRLASPQQYQQIQQLLDSDAASALKV